MSSRPTTASNCPQAPDENILVERARARDDSAFQELVFRYTPKLSRLVSRVVKSTSDQEEVLQNAWIAAWRNLPSFEGRSQFGSWIYRVTTNESLMLLRQYRRRHETSASDIEGLVEAESGAGLFCGRKCWVDRPDEAMQRTELRALLQRKVENLAPMLREVFVLRYVDGLSVKETAKRIGASEPAVKTRTHRACLTLREAIHRSAADVRLCSGKPSARLHLEPERIPAKID